MPVKKTTTHPKRHYERRKVVQHTLEETPATSAEASTPPAVTMTTVPVEAQTPATAIAETPAAPVKTEVNVTSPPTSSSAPSQSTPAVSVVVQHPQPSATEPVVEVPATPAETTKIVTDETADLTEPSRKWWKIILTVIIFILIGALVPIVGYKLYQYGIREGQKKIAPSPSPEASVLPSPSPVQAISPEEIAKHPIRVLNGSGISGEAGRVRTLLKDNDFIVSGVGNAPNSNYKETVIQAKTTVPQEFVEELTKVLETVYLVDQKVATLSASEKDEVIVIVGKNKVSSQ